MSKLKIHLFEHIIEAIFAWTNNLSSRLESLAQSGADLGFSRGGIFKIFWNIVDRDKSPRINNSRYGFRIMN